MTNVTKITSAADLANVEDDFGNIMPMSPAERREAESKRREAEHTAAMERAKAALAADPKMRDGCGEPGCVVCSTGMSADEFYERIDSDVKKHGRHVLSVMGGGSDPAFSYTIGNHCQGAPELIVFGLDYQTGTWLLNTVSEAILRSMEDGSEYGEGIVDVGGKCPVKVVRASHPDLFREYLVQVPRYLRHADWESADHVLVMQVLVPDTKGRFPGEAGCDSPYADVPVLRSN